MGVEVNDTDAEIRNNALEEEKEGVKTINVQRGNIDVVTLNLVAEIHTTVMKIKEMLEKQSQKE